MPNVCRRAQILSPVSGSAGLDVKRAEVAMCKAVQIVRGSLSSYSSLLRQALHMATSDQRYQNPLCHACKLWQLAAVGIIPTIVFFSAADPLSSRHAFS